MKILSYNIWNYLPNIESRLHHLFQYLKQNPHHILALQEVTPQSLNILKDKLDDTYSFHYYSDCFYFNCILVHNSIEYHKSIVTPFNNTTMKRHFITLEIPNQFVIITSHLESGGHSADVRQKQANELVNFVNNNYSDTPVLFCGDTNIFKGENDVFPPFQEVRGEGYEYTYNPLKNPLCDDYRPSLIDRVYVKGDINTAVQIIESNLISDHYGLSISTSTVQN